MLYNHQPCHRAEKKRNRPGKNSLKMMVRYSYPRRTTLQPEAMEERISVAVAARQSKDFFLVARTDAREPEGWIPPCGELNDM